MEDENANRRLFIVEYYDRHLEKWLPATNTPYATQHVAELDKNRLEEDFSQNDYRISKIG
jgi:hypothetical protein